MALLLTRLAAVLLGLLTGASRVIQALLVHVIYWWGFWAYRELESWNFAFFAFVLLNPGLIFVCSNTLVLGVRGPDASWEQHFFSVRKWFFVMWGAMAVVATLRNWLVLSTPLLTPGRLPMLVVFIVCGVGLYSTDRRVPESPPIDDVDE